MPSSGLVTSGAVFCFLATFGAAWGLLSPHPHGFGTFLTSWTRENGKEASDGNPCEDEILTPADHQAAVMQLLYEVAVLKCENSKWELRYNELLLEKEKQYQTLSQEKLQLYRRMEVLLVKLKKLKESGENCLRVSMRVYTGMQAEITKLTEKLERIEQNQAAAPSNHAVNNN